MTENDYSKTTEQNLVFGHIETFYGHIVDFYRFLRAMIFGW
jgi:hypothetical protein